MLDFYDRESTAKVYEIFVLKEFRQNRVGSGRLKHPEVSAKELGAIRLELEVHSLDPELTDAWLRRWYSSHGFIEAAEPGVMAKDLQNTADQSASEA
ncbi:GNAT family N-acetyltransferase [Burkholderia anthina]|uniref:GNAT family N-acetyltransferase n=1 Tax=Burkholderia anthina TaxID=179879 RepID=UPI001589ACDE|nr:GNAT family N-acetyltransferase [Burkholderia anthina]